MGNRHSDGEPPTVRIVTTVCGTLVVLALVAAIVYSNKTGGDTGTLYALVLAIGASVFPSLQANARVTALSHQVDKLKRPRRGMPPAPPSVPPSDSPGMRSDGAGTAQ